MAEEKSILSRSTEAGSIVTQGRGGQAIVQDVVGNIILTTQNKLNSNQQTLSVKDSISSITLLSGETPISIETQVNFPSNNFNTINWEQTPIGGVQVIQAQPQIPSKPNDLSVVEDVPPPQSSVTTEKKVQEESKITPVEEQLLFLPDNETQVFAEITDQGISGTGLEIISFVNLDLNVLSTPESTKNSNGSLLSGGYSTFNDNNPMNIINTNNNWVGKIGKKQARNSGLWFVVFDTPENGIRAALINLSNYFTKYNRNTVEKIINAYAPGGSAGQSNANTELYKKNVTKYLQDNFNKNINRNTILKFNGKNETDPNNIKMFKLLAKAILKVEGTQNKYYSVIDNFDIKKLN
jgi:hypothetical protein